MPTQALSPRNERLAFNLLRFPTLKAAAEATGISVPTAKSVLANTIFQAFFMDLRRQVREAGVATVTELICRQAEPSVQTLIELRDDTAVEAATRRGCANDLLDRNPETAKIHKAESKNDIRIEFGPEVVHYLDRVIGERPGQQVIDAPAVAIPAVVEPSVRSIDDVIEAYAEADP
jgi:hypothetical protein